MHLLQTRAYFKKKLGGKLVDNPQVTGAARLLLLPFFVLACLCVRVLASRMEIEMGRGYQELFPGHVPMSNHAWPQGKDGYMRVLLTIHLPSSASTLT